MTVQNTITKNIYIGNGSTTSFPFTFPCPKADYIKVFVRKNNLIAQTDNFTVDMDKATVTYPKSGTPLAAGENLVILRELPLEQPLNLVNQGPFFAEDIETTLDEEVMMIQQLREQLGRSLTVPVDIDAENAFETSVPIKPGMSFRVKDDGSGFEETDDPARVLPLASDALKKAEAARDVAIAKADAAGASAVSAAESEVAADRSATQAEAAKTNAKASETAAAQSAAAAQVSEGNAKTSETNALTHETNAKASADKAQTSETNAAGSASTASAKASAASASAAAAKASETAAATSASAANASKVAAKTSEDAAAKSAAAAKTSETAAKVSESKAKASETNAKTSETNAGKSATTATTKASEASVSATNAKASETAAKVSETNAKSSEGKAKTSETNAGVSATTATQQATKATTEANRAKTEADRAKTAADSVGNPVVNITQSNGNLTITKGDGSSNTLTVTPAVASLAEAEAGTDNTKMMTPLRVAQVMATGLNNVALLEGSLNQFIIDNQFLGEVQQGCVRKLESDISTLVDIGVDALIINLTSGNKVIIDAKQIFGGVANSIVRVCTIVLTGSVSAPIEWVNCKMMCEAPPKNSNKDTIVTFYITADTHYLVSAMEEG